MRTWTRSRLRQASLNCVAVAGVAGAAEVASAAVEAVETVVVEVAVTRVPGEVAAVVVENPPRR